MRNWPHCQRLGTRMPSTSSSSATKTGSTRSHTGWFGTSRMRSTVSRKRWSQHGRRSAVSEPEARVSTWLHQIVLRKASDYCRIASGDRHCQLPRKGRPSSRPSPIRQMNGSTWWTRFTRWTLISVWWSSPATCSECPFTKPHTHLASPKALSSLVLAGLAPDRRACPPNRCNDDPLIQDLRQKLGDLRLPGRSRR